MSYEWPLAPTDLFRERYPQIVSSLPRADVDKVRNAITNMWENAAGGWVYEWSQLAEHYGQTGDHFRASLAYGWAKFPVLADAAKRQAFQNQLKAYELAAATFPIKVERNVLSIPYEGTRVPVAVHLLARSGLSSCAPVLIASGGVDTWKMDLHSLFADIATALPYRVMAFDIPGTGETEVPLNENAYQVIQGIIATARELGNGKVAHFGFSMGGYFSALSGLSAAVDAAIVIGGPVEKAFKIGRKFTFGMDHIVGNAFGFNILPSENALAQRMAPLSLRHLLEREDNCPMFVANGENDVHVPAEDTLIFNDRRHTQVMLVPDTGHCAIENQKITSIVLPAMISWLTEQQLTT